MIKELQIKATKPDWQSLKWLIIFIAGKDVVKCLCLYTLVGNIN